ncbi:MAG: HAD-IA family hydrolase [Candidatus Eisenbacteria bacterium]
MAMPKKPRFLLFDLDGTLVETLTDIACSVNHALIALGLPPHSLEEVRTFVGRGVEVLVERAAGEDHRDLGEAVLDLFRAHYDGHCLDNSSLLPGAMECLDFFRDRGLGVVSNKPELYVRRILDGLGIADRFSVVFGGDTVEERKPSPLMVRMALKRMNLAPDEGILIGDMPVDVETGRAAGVFTVAVLGGFGSREMIEEAGPDLLVESLYELTKRFE